MKTSYWKDIWQKWKKEKKVAEKHTVEKDENKAIFKNVTGNDISSSDTDQF